MLRSKRPKRLHAIVASCAIAASACTLFVDTGDLTGGALPAGAPDASRDDGRPLDRAEPKDAPPPDAGADAPTDAPDDGESFSDDFERTGASIGNGWTEKAPGTFFLVGGVVRKAKNAIDYKNDLVFRPVAEDRRDVEVTITTEIASVEQPFPQVFARAQRDTILTANTYDAYILFVNAAAEARIARQRGPTQEVELAVIGLTQTLVNGQRVRLTLRTTGDNPVNLDGTVETTTTTGSGWTVIGRGAASDSNTARLSTAGAVGFTAAEAYVPAFDDFRWRTIRP